MLQVVVVVGNYFTSDVAKLTLSWIHHHHVHRITIDLLHSILVIAMSISLVGIHFKSIELLGLNLGHVYF